MKIRKVLVGLAATLLLPAGVGIGVAASQPAQAGTPTPASTITTQQNPWVLSMNNPDKTKPGLNIYCNDGPNGQCFQVFDHLQQPIVAVNKAGGFGVFGDNSSIFQGPDPFHAWVQMSISDPIASNCVTNGQFVIGGSVASGGKIWQCKDKRWHQVHLTYDN